MYGQILTLELVIALIYGSCHCLPEELMLFSIIFLNHHFSVLVTRPFPPLPFIWLTFTLLSEMEPWTGEIVGWLQYASDF